MGLGIEKGHIAGLQNFLLNMSLVVTLGFFAGLALRSLVLLALDRGRPNRVIVLRAVAASAFLLFGCFDFLFASTMLVWDRPPRAVFAALAVAFPLITVARKKKGSVKSPSSRHAAIVGAAFVGLSLFSAVTLLRAGTVALTGDRVTLTVEVTGEEIGGAEPTAAGTGAGRAALRHVIVWLPSGDRLADVWLPAERLCLKGRIYRVSTGLNRLGIPNLYEFQSVEGVAVGPNGEDKTIAGDLPALADGPMGVHPWWRPIQLFLLSRWEAATSDGSFLALRTIPNASPFYPLVDAQGHAMRKTFLLVLPPSGNATSRGSSPLEKDVPPSY